MRVNYKEISEKSDVYHRQLNHHFHQPGPLKALASCFEAV